MGRRSTYYPQVAVTATSGTDFTYSFTSWVNRDLDPLGIPCEHSIWRPFASDRMCGRSLEEHMLADLGHTYVKDRAWADTEGDR